MMQKISTHQALNRFHCKPQHQSWMHDESNEHQAQHAVSKTEHQSLQVHVVRHTLVQLYHRYASLGMTCSPLPWRRQPGHKLAKDDHHWEARIGDPYWKWLHCVQSVPSCTLSCLCFTHRLFQMAKIDSLVGIQDSKDPEGSWVFYYLVQSEGTLSTLCFPKHESWIVPLYPFLTVLYTMASRPDQKDSSTPCLCTNPSSQPRLLALLWRLSSLRLPTLPPHCRLSICVWLPSPCLPQITVITHGLQFAGVTWTSVDLLPLHIMSLSGCYDWCADMNSHLLQTGIVWQRWTWFWDCVINTCNFMMFYSETFLFLNFFVAISFRVIGSGSISIRVVSGSSVCVDASTICLYRP